MYFFFFPKRFCFVVVARFLVAILCLFLCVRGLPSFSLRTPTAIPTPLHHPRTHLADLRLAASFAVPRASPLFVLTALDSCVCVCVVVCWRSFFLVFAPSSCTLGVWGSTFPAFPASVAALLFCFHGVIEYASPALFRHCFFSACALRVFFFCFPLALSLCPIPSPPPTHLGSTARTRFTSYRFGC